MTWPFSLSLECGGGTDCEAIARHFRDLQIALSDGRSVGVDIRVDDNWVVVEPQGFTHSGIQSVSDAREMSVAGAALIDHLRSLQGFRFALVGVDTERFIEYDELDATYAGDSVSGLIVRDEIWQRLGRPRNYQKFSRGYHWQPYQGEHFDPL